MNKSARFPAPLLLALALVGCPGPNPVEPGLRLVLDGSLRTVGRGDELSLPVTLELQGTVVDPVSLTLQGFPSEISSTATSVTPSSSTAKTTLPVSIGAAAPLGLHEGKLVATSGALRAEVAVIFQVQETGAPSFSLALQSTSLSVVAGSSGQLTAALTARNGFSGAVTLALENAPAGVAVMPAEVQLTGAQTQATVTLSVPAGAAIESRQVTLTAVQGAVKQSAAFTLDIRRAGAPDFGLALGQGTLTLAAGASGKVSVQLQRLAGFSEAVTLSIAGLPANVSAAPVTLGPAESSGMLSVTAAAGAADFNGQVTVTGTAAVAGTRTVPLALVVTAVTPDFELSVAPSSVSVAPGESAAVTVSVVRKGGFADAIPLALSLGPAGVTAAAATISAGGASAQLTLVAAPNAPVGSAQAKISGTAASKTHQATLAISVSPPSTGPKLDVSYGTDGLGAASWGTQQTYTRDLALQPDGKVLALGYYGSSPNVVLARFTTHGALDTGFGLGGKVRDTSVYYAIGLAVLSDGKILVLSNNNGAMLTRLLPDGSLDNGFGTAGHVNISTVNGLTFIAYRLELQPDGKLLVAGEAGGAGIVVRLSAAGAADSTFGTAGIYRDGALESVTALALAPDGTVLLAGTTATTPSDARVSRLTAGGVLDGAFGTGGNSTFDIATTSDTVLAGRLAADGSFLVLVTATSVGTSLGAVLRVQPSGALSTTWGVAGGSPGKVRLPMPWVPTALTVAADGRVYLSQALYAAGLYRGALTRLSPEGAHDAAWANPAGGTGVDVGGTKSTYLRNLLVAGSQLYAVGDRTTDLFVARILP